MMLAEEVEEYKIPTEEERKYGQENIEKINKKHDKMVKVIFSQKREVAAFLNQFLNLKEKINNLIYPIVIPIVIYTGFQKWTAKTKLSQKQYNEKAYQEYQNNLWYNLVTVQDYTFEELLKTNTLFTSFMIIEKCETKEELLIYAKKIIDKVKKEGNKKLAKNIIKKILVLFLEKEVIVEMLKDLEKEEEISMSPVTKMLLDLELKGEERGIAKGIMQNINKTAQKMLRKNMNLKDIEEITGLSKEEIKKLQECG